MALVTRAAAIHRGPAALQRLRQADGLDRQLRRSPASSCCWPSGLNVVVGLAGLLDLGYAAFFAIGAYTYAYGSSTFTGLRHPLLGDAAHRRPRGRGLRHPAGRTHAAPARRLPGHRDARLRRDRAGASSRTPRNGPTARRASPASIDPSSLASPAAPAVRCALAPPRRCPTTSSWPCIITVTMIVLYRLQDSRLGRSWQAIREDELAAASNGINTVTTKLLAFALGASTAGLAGVLRRLQVHQRLTRAIPVLGLVHRAGHGRAGWHRQHLGRGPGRLHHLHTSRACSSSSSTPSSTASTCPILSDIDFHPVPVPALRSGTGGHDAAATGRPVPESHDGPPSCTSGTSRSGADVEGADPEGPLGRGGDMSDIDASAGAPGGGQTARRREPRIAAPCPSHHQAVRRPGRRQRRPSWSSPRVRSSASSDPTEPARRPSSTCVAGILDPTDGQIEFRGQKMVARAAARLAGAVLLGRPGRRRRHHQPSAVAALLAAVAARRRC